MAKIIVWSKERGVRTLKEGVSVDSYRAKYPSVIVVKRVPTVATMEKWVSDGVARSIDGCRVEPDGECEHGYPSWLMALGFV